MVQCCYLWNPEVVKNFAEDDGIRRSTSQSLFKHEVKEGKITCIKTLGHSQCTQYKSWKTTHPVEAADLIKRATSSCKSIYIPSSKTIVVNGNNVKIQGGIKSLDPPCQGEAFSNGDNPYTCNNCASQMRDLKNTLQHRKTCSYLTVSNRIGLDGFNKRYAKKGEIRHALETEVNRRKSAEKQISQLVRVNLSPLEWERHLLTLCSSQDECKLIIDLVRLFGMGKTESNSIQLLVIKNLVSKLLKSRNHHYVDLIKDMSGLFKNQLGPTNYAILSNLFGLAGTTTAVNHVAVQRLEPGLDLKALERAAATFKNLPVNEGSDGARALRYLQPFMTRSGEVVLLGQCWNPVVSQWSEELMPIPRKSEAHGDQDDFEALKRYIQKLICENHLSKSVSVHTLVSLATVNNSTFIYCMWPEPNKGYKAEHLLLYWENLRRNCFYDETGKTRESPIHLLGYSTDSAGFSLAASVQLMTPTAAEVKNGVCFLGLGTVDERFLAPYYWFLPSIPYLDYDHEQRLFLKNLKYETRDLTFWEESGCESRVATIQHLKDLRQKCQRVGLECGLNATDLVLIYFFDQNSDACERLFTERIADLLDKFVPGSQGTSLYIRAVYNLIEPFRNPAFGTPPEVQRSVSSAITVFRLWKKVLELKKLRLHSLPGAKNDPSKRGHFLTHGCYQTAEIQFAAATVHQLAMFLHFKDFGPQWASPYCSGTKATERVISEMQGKTNEIQSLDAQPSFADMLQKSSSVQFNLNAKSRLASAGAKVKVSAKRRQRAFAFKEHACKVVKMYSYPDSFEEFRNSQKQAHLDGVKIGQLLFSKYMPEACVQLLKNSDSWEVPYKYCHPESIHIVNSSPPEGYNRLHESFALAKQNIKESPVEDIDEEECVPAPTLEKPHVNDTIEGEQDQDEELLTSKEEEKGRRWRISKRLEDGTVTQIHIRQAIKLLLPREYIARCRQKRHWAAKYLPGKAPIDPKHDIIKFCDVAFKCVHKGVQSYKIGRVEMLQSSKDGSDLTSFKLSRNAHVRFRCSLYIQVFNDNSYQVPHDVMLTSWKSASSLIGPVHLLEDNERPGFFSLHPKNKDSLEKMGFYSGQVSSPTEVKERNDEDSDQPELEDGFFEVEDILNKRLCKGTLNYEYKVRFKGYGSEDDMWLPASFFNRAIHFESISKYGRKRKHVTEADDFIDELQQVKQKKLKRIKQVGSSPADVGEQQSKRTTGKGRFSLQATSAVEHGKDCKGQWKANLRKPKPTLKGIPMTFSTKEKGIRFRQSLRCTNTINSSSDSDSEIEVKSSFQNGKAKKVIEDSDITEIKEKLSMLPTLAPSTRESELSSNSDSSSRQIHQLSTASRSKNIFESCKEISFIDEKTFSTLINTKKAQFLVAETNAVLSTSTSDNFFLNDVRKNTNPYAYAPSICEDLLRGTDDFVTGREELQQLKIPPTNPMLTVLSVISLSQAQHCLNPLAVYEVPPLNTVEESEFQLRDAKKTSSVPNAAILIENYGVLNKRGLTALRQYHRFKVIGKEVEEEKRWIRHAFCQESDSDRKMVEDALFKNKLGQSKFLVSRNGSRVTAQVLSTFCDERYLCDESINVLLHHYCTQANTREKKSSFLSLPAYLSDTRTAKEVIKASVKQNLRGIVPEEVECIFVPAHFEGKDHWGLGIINLKKGTVSFDDGFHVPKPPSLVRICKQTVKAIRETSNCSVRFPTSLKYQRLSPPMPDQVMGVHQQHGYGSCGVAVILCVRDLCNREKHFKWNFNQSPSLRAKLMIELVKLSGNY